MKYAVKRIIQPPISVEWIREADDGYLVIVESHIKSIAKDGLITIPIHQDATDVKMRMTKGTALYEAENDCIKWRISYLSSGTYYALRITCNSFKDAKKIWLKDKIKAQFSIQNYSPSLMNLKNVSLFERENYKYECFVRSITDLRLTFDQNC